MNCAFWFRLVFFFPGTVLHELAHYSAALLLGRAEGFSVIPAKEGGVYVLGSVRSRTRYKILSSFVALAPLAWWLALFLLLRHLRVVATDAGLPQIHAAAERLWEFRPADLFFLWVSLQLLWAGRPSLPDIKNALRGICSLSGLLLAAALAAAYYLLRQL